MKMLTALLAVLLLFGTAEAAPTNVVTPPSCHKDVASLPIYKLEVTSSTDMGNGVTKWSPYRGSTFLIEKNFWFTAAHTMDNGEIQTGMIRVGGSYIEAELVYVDAKRDVAILYGDSGNLKPLNLQTKPLNGGEPVWSVGFPGVTGSSQVSFEGSAMALSGRGFVVTSAMALPGMSGGPLLRCNKDSLEAVGVVVSFATERLQYAEINEDGTTSVSNPIIINTGISYSSPRLPAHLSEGMARRLEVLEVRQNQLKQDINNINEEIKKIQ